MAQQHDVTLSWTPPTTGEVPVGYNVKRGTATGGPYTTLNPTPVPGSSYIDNSAAVQAEGSRFFYVVTSVGATAESIPSDEASALIPLSAIYNYQLIKGSVLLKGSIVNGPIGSQQAACSGVQPYPCARTDNAILAFPATPNMGNEIGANLSYQDPEFNNIRTTRVTDASYSTNNMLVSNGGGDWDNYFSKLSTKLLVTANGGSHYVLNFDSDPASPTYMQTSNRYPGWFFPGDVQFSAIDDNKIFALNGTALKVYDVSVPSTPPTPTVLVDFTAAGPNCLPSNYWTGLPGSSKWSSFGGVGHDDDLFTASFSNVGVQNSGFDVIAWSPTKGCMHMRTDTGDIVADLGWAGGSGLTCDATHCTGTISIPDRMTIHSTIANWSGSYLDIGVGTCLNTCNNNSSPYVWTVGTTTLAYHCSMKCGGHSVMGNNKWLNRSGSPAGVWQIRDVAAIGSPVDTNTAPVNFASSSPISMHIAWRNDDGTDTHPFLSTHVYFDNGNGQHVAPTNPPLGPWWNELLAISPVNGTVWRFGRMWTAGDSTFFTAQQGIGAVSQDGKFFAFTSDWHKTLGLTSGGKPRGDVFVMELK